MAKTIFVNGNPAQGILGTVVTAEFLNAANKHHHTGKDVDGEGALPYAADTGEADAYAIALDPALSEYITGMPICFKAANTNTGPSTLNVNGIGAITIKKNVNEALVAGDIAANQLVAVIHDGANFQLVNNGQSTDKGQFVKYLAGIGYQKLPGGLIMQWGSTLITAGALTLQAANFPIVFPTSVLFVVGASGSINSWGGAVLGNSSTSFIGVWANNDGAVVNWIALGF